MWVEHFRFIRGHVADQALFAFEGTDGRLSDPRTVDTIVPVVPRTLMRIALAPTKLLTISHISWDNNILIFDGFR